MENIHADTNWEHKWKNKIEKQTERDTTYTYAQINSG